ncbi:MAG: hypothetical protein KF757_09780 [Phycisphaeraceae bacterium]|nr:hypothetical protein [Phycisphaeraceae bacterium]MCW5763501.1 hypothetical protein [Phycisphaeraceae bacterium]
MDKHDLYELCVQSPRHLVPLLRAVHSRNPLTLGEDFSGTASLSQAWVDAAPDRLAIATDIDPSVLARRPEHPRLIKRPNDIRQTCDNADLIFAGNFSIGYMHTRAELIGYLQHVRSRLLPGGCFCCDTYGGESAFLTGSVQRDHFAPDGSRILYIWEQRQANPLTGRVVDVLHFHIERDGIIEEEFPDAFIYDWRLWSVPELRDAMREAGFRDTAVYLNLPDAEDEAGEQYAFPIDDPDELEDSFIVIVAARV